MPFKGSFDISIPTPIGPTEISGEFEYEEDNSISDNDIRDYFLDLEDEE
ncbi:hypothetical protein [Bacillus coahuilensis]|nr:hypothetical protein [Bacillus coahuilensis]